MWVAYKPPRQIDINEIYTLFICEYTPGFSFPGESHNFWEIVYVINGKLKVTGDERSYILSQGDIVFHKPMEIHKLDVIGEENVEVLTLSFSMGGEICDYYKEKSFSLTLSQVESVNGLISMIPYRFKKNHEDISDSKLFTPFYFSPEQLQLAYQYITALFLQLYNNGKALQYSRKAETLLFRNMVIFLKDNLHLQVGVSDLANKFFMSETSVKRIFSNNSGMGVHSYFLKLKIEKSVEFITEGMSVSEVSKNLGFGDNCYFSTVFKREMGMTISEFRKRIMS